MVNVKPSMRLKVKKGTFFMPESNGSVYFRNNAGSFRMEGKAIQQWVEKLVPMLNGEHSMADLTEGLSLPYRTRVYEMAEVLYTNGFLRDVSEDRHHELHPEVAAKFASQIEFLESFGDSACYRFQQFRQKKVIVVGEGDMVIGVVSALLTSGLATAHVIITDEEESSRRRVRELEAWARESDSEAAVSLAMENSFSWTDEIEPYEAVFYASHKDQHEERKAVLEACQKKQKWLIPILYSGTAGFAGPMEQPGSVPCFESAWRSLHTQEADEEAAERSISSPAAAMLTNVAVFEWFKKVTGVPDVHPSNHMFVLTNETLEGKWHPFKPNPLVTGSIAAERVENVLKETKEKEENEAWLYYFSEMASGPLGIFHRYEEGDLPQLPLSQCEVQAVDIQSVEPHPGIICAAMTHEEARKEAGLTGVEQYLAPLKQDILNALEAAKDRESRLYLGAGESGTRTAISRSLTNMLEENWKTQVNEEKGTPARLELRKVEDERCRFYYQALTTMKKEPELGIGEDAYGFPVVWIKTRNNQWYGTVGFTRTLALRGALRRALLEAQNNITFPEAPVVSIKEFKKGLVQLVDVPSCESDDPEVLQSVIERIKRSHKDLSFIKVTMDPFKDDGIIDLFGVVVSEEESG
ncbi:ThiF family adenylyltransferase [Halobacillus sp. B29]|uniref:ThiF family adenylyltransferase n=1 Tax=Halobacillus sp. B29 TaxID=3457432 RepID=UPI003FCD3DB6